MLICCPTTSQGGGSSNTAFTHEPAGYTLLTNNEWTSLSATQWHDNQAPADATWGLSARIINDSSAVYSAQSVLQMQYQANMTDAESSRAFQYVSGLTTCRRLYIALFVKLHPNFIGHTSGTNKFYFPVVVGNGANGEGGGNWLYASMMGTGTNNLEPVVNTQGVRAAGTYSTGGAVASQDAHCNLASTCSLSRNSWHKWEVVVVGNTANTSDGSVEWWINDTRVGAYSGCNFQSIGTGATTFNQVNFDPVWGGNRPISVASSALSDFGLGDGSTYSFDLRLDVVRIAGSVN